MIETYEFKTIRQTAAMGILPEHRIRMMVAQGKCPGVVTGNRFMVNVSMLVGMLDKESRKCPKFGTYRCKETD